jgi:hypothetical protein
MAFMKRIEQIDTPNRIPGLAEALFRGDQIKVAELLSGIAIGKKIEVWNMILEVQTPNELELQLLERSKKERREFGLVSAGEIQEVIEGKNDELNDREVLGIVQRFSASNGHKYFSHTHWDEGGTPIPSGPDLATFRTLKDVFGFDCRVISWLPDNKVFVFRGEVK